MIRPKRPAVARPSPQDSIVRPNLIKTQHGKKRRPGFAVAFSGCFKRIRQPTPQQIDPYRIDWRVEVRRDDQRLIGKFASQLRESIKRRLAKHQRVRLHVHQQDSHLGAVNAERNHPVTADCLRFFRNGHVARLHGQNFTAAKDHHPRTKPPGLISRNPRSPEIGVLGLLRRLHKSDDVGIRTGKLTSRRVVSEVSSAHIPEHKPLRIDRTFNARTSENLPTPNDQLHPQQEQTRCGNPTIFRPPKARRTRDHPGKSQNRNRQCVINTGQNRNRILHRHRQQSSNAPDHDCRSNRAANCERLPA